MEKVTEYIMEQSKKNTAQLFQLIENAVTSSVTMVNEAQSEAQQITSRLTEKGKEQFVAQLANLQVRLIEAQTEFQDQFRNLLQLFKQEGK
jgi:F0F1-type ATP synthase membrane subunit b/b'